MVFLSSIVRTAGRRALWVAVPLGAMLTACSPTLDWREVRAEGSDAVALFPCKPSHEVRTVPIHGVATRMTLNACRAGDAFFSLAYADVGDPGQVTSVLEAFRLALAVNLGAAVEASAPAAVSGMTPHPQAQRIKLRGQRPDGTAVHQEAVFFAKGLRVFQAVVMAPQLDAEAVDTFFDNLKLPS